MLTRRTISLTVFAALAAGAIIAIAGPLNPPGGPITSTGKTTQEVFDKVGTAEPRTALSAANTPGDADSMFTINQSGSYYLTADVYVGAAKSGIKIINGNAPNVTIDLNGFTIHGFTGTLDGIRTTSVPGGSTLRIHNGAITGMGAIGVNVNAQCLDLTQVAVQFSGQDGFNYSGQAITITNCRAFWNTGDGFHSLSAANISECTAELNTSDGFEIGAGLLSHCNSLTSTGRGVVSAFGLQITDCHIGSFGDAITVGNNCTVARNWVNAPSPRIGIHATGASNRIEENDIQGTGTGVLVDGATGNIVVKNFARGNSTAYSVTGSNFLGPVVSNVSGVAGAGPWANFAY